MPKLYQCVECGNEFYINNGQLPYIDEKNRTVCDSCHHEWRKACGFNTEKGTPTTSFNEPTHYHQGQMDTIEFLQKGFPPEVCMGFFLGNVIKYAQRANYKNGVEDFEKMVDYANRALDWYKRRYVE